MHIVFALHKNSHRSSEDLVGGMTMVARALVGGDGEIVGDV